MEVGFCFGGVTPSCAWSSGIRFRHVQVKPVLYHLCSFHPPPLICLAVSGLVPGSVLRNHSPGHGASSGHLQARQAPHLLFSLSWCLPGFCHQAVGTLVSKQRALGLQIALECCPGIGSFSWSKSCCLVQFDHMRKHSCAGKHSFILSRFSAQDVAQGLEHLSCLCKSLGLRPNDSHDQTKSQKARFLIPVFKVHILTENMTLSSFPPKAAQSSFWRTLP